MSRSFSSTEAMHNNGNIPITAYPFTMFAWGNKDVQDGGGSDDVMMGMTDDSASLIYQLLSTTNAGSGTSVGMVSRNSSTQQAARGTTEIALDTWYSTCGICRGNTDREIFLEGVTEDTDANSVTWNSNIDSIAIGARRSSGGFTTFYEGRLSHCAVYNVSLSTTHQLALSRGAHPFIMRNDALVFFCAVEGNDSPEGDYVGQSAQQTLSGSPPKFVGNPPVELLENYL